MSSNSDMFDRLLVQELRNLRRRVPFCNGGFNEVLQRFAITAVVSESEEIVVTGKLAASDAGSLLSRLRNGETEVAGRVWLSEITAVNPGPPVNLTDIDSTDPLVVARKVEVRMYAAERFASDNNDTGDVTVEHANEFLVALGIEPLNLTRYTYRVPVAGFIGYEAWAETSEKALAQVKRDIEYDINQDYLERGDGPEEMLPSGLVEPELVEPREQASPTVKFDGTVLR